MLTNYLKTIARTLRKHKSYTLINVSGLAVGMACAFVLFLFVRLENSFDLFHEKTDRIYRVVTEVHTQTGQVTNIAYTAPGMAPDIVDAFPEVEYAVRLVNREVVMRHKEDHNLENVLFVDSTFFDVFSFALLRGDPATALMAPRSLVMTQEMAAQYFDTEDPIGKTITFGDGRETWDWQITGILADLPPNSHIRFDFLASFSTLSLSRDTDWGRLGLWSYLVLNEAASPAALEAKFPDLAEARAGEWARDMLRLHLQHLPSIYFDSDLLAEIGPTGDRTYLYIFSAIGVLILLIACINFMNLSTARSFHRAREVGVRKVLGAQRGQLIRQFLSESLLLVSLASLFALVLVQLLLPVFSELADRDLTVDYLGSLPYLIGIVLIAGLAAGGYPALFLSAFAPVKVLKGRLETQPAGRWVRKGLVVVQFGISIILLIGTATVYNQLQYIQNKRLGFNQEQVVAVRVDPMRQHADLIKEALEQNPDILQVSATAGLPGFPIAPRSYMFEGLEEGNMMVNTIWTDADYQQALEVEMATGRFFDEAMRTDSAAFVINEAAVREFGWNTPEDALGKQIEASGPAQTGSVIGVVKDFHYASLHQSIQPLIMRMGPRFYRTLAVRIRGDRIMETMDFIEQQWASLVPDQPIVTTFLDENMEQLYQREQRFGTLFAYFAGIAIVIACLGLFGLAAFTAEQRTKEVGIRKVLGSTIPGAATLLAKEYVILILIANLLAWPVAYLVMERWLQAFVYRIDLGLLIFVVAGLVAFAIAIGTVSYQSIKTALVNPVDALRHE